jgi:hypothetical protein
MILAEQDVIPGILQDLQFRAILMLGSGGVVVKGLKDVAFALAPLNTKGAEEMLENTWAGRKLYGYRNLPTTDRQAVLVAFMNNSRLACDFPELKEIDINPLRALEAGQGVYGIDVRIRLQK